MTDDRLFVWFYNFKDNNQMIIIMVKMIIHLFDFVHHPDDYYDDYL